MSMISQLSSDDRDQLKEFLNIGVAHAGDTLSQMLDHRVTISVPLFDIKNAETVARFVENPNEVTIAVLLRLSGGIDGYVLLYFPYSAAVHLLHALSGKTVGDLRALDQYDRSIFQEVGNVLTGGMLQGLSKFLHIQIIQSVPDVVIDMGGAMFNSLSATMIAAHDEFLALDVAVCVDAAPDSVSCVDGEQAVGRMFLFLGPDAAARILELTRPMLSP